jgi:hypothetical protein
MEKKIAIVIPNHRANLKWNEEISLQRCKEVFGKYDVILVHPEKMDLEEHKKYGIITKFIGLDPKYFKSDLMYNRLMNIPYFYRNFLEYDYILIYQLDTFIFENNLEEWCNMNFDYIGAPWIDSEWMKANIRKMPVLSKFYNLVGNGGLSLRKVKTFYRGSIFLYPLALFWKGNWHEDVFWSAVAKKFMPGFKIPDVKTALKFAFEEHPEKCYEMNDHQLPFGCHAWEKYNTAFWAVQLKKYGYDISDKIVQKSPVNVE